MSVDRLLGIKIYDILSEYWSSLELDKLSYETKASTIYKQAKELNEKLSHIGIQNMYGQCMVSGSVLM